MSNEKLSLPQSFDLRTQGWEVDVEVISQNLNEEQYALVVQVKQLSAVVHMAGFERAKRLRLLRDSFPIGGNPNIAARMGWADFLRREFDTNVCDVNREIAAIEAADDFPEEKRSGPARAGILDKIGSTHLNEIGRGSSPAIRRKVWDKLFDGKLNLNKRAIRAEVKLLNSDAGKLMLKGSAPPKAPSAPKLPVPSKTPNGEAMSVSYWTKPGTQQGNKMLKELAYLAATESKNQSFVDGLTELRRKSRAGKLARIQALAAALHAECKAVSDRYQLESEKTGRKWKRYMTVWQHHWTDTDQLDMAKALKQIASEMAEASRHFEITGMLSWSDNVKVED